MIKFPYSEDASIFDKETFELLSCYFDLVRDYRTKNLGRWAGYQVFKYNPEKVGHLPSRELVRLVPYLFVYDDFAFTKNGSKPKAKEILTLLKEKGVTSETFLEEMITFEFSQLGNESAQSISAIAYALNGGKDYDALHECEGMGSRFPIWLERWKKNQQLCAAENDGREQPFTLEKILKIGAEPVALDYAPEGGLYVLDNHGKVQEFTFGHKTAEWPIRYGFRNRGITTSDEIFAPVFANITVRDGILFLTNGSSIERHDLAGIKEQTTPGVTRSTGNLLQKWKEEIDEQDILFHDVCIKDGNVLVSASLQTAVRFILQITAGGKYKVIYQGPFPRTPQMTSNLTDLTLRLGLYKGGLYFSEENGISLYTLQGSREMLGTYKRETLGGIIIDPITKFAFGEDFMVASGFVKGFQMPMLQIFRPAYENNSRELVTTDSQPQPARWERQYIADIPKHTGRMIQELSITAQGDRFALSHRDFERVFVYRMKGEKKEQNLG